MNYSDQAKPGSLGAAESRVEEAFSAFAIVSETVGDASYSDLIQIYTREENLGTSVVARSSAAWPGTPWLVHGRDSDGLKSHRFVVVAGGQSRVVLPGTLERWDILGEIGHLDMVVAGDIARGWRVALEEKERRTGILVGNEDMETLGAVGIGRK